MDTCTTINYHGYTLREVVTLNGTSDPVTEWLVTDPTGETGIVTPDRQTAHAAVDEHMAA